VAGLVIAITVVLLSGGSDDGDDTATENTTTTAADDGDEGDEDQTDETDDLNQDDIAAMDDEEVVEADPLGMNAVVDDMVTEFGGAIDEDDARCMMGAAVDETIVLGHFGDDDIAAWPEDDQVALMSAMFDCVDDPEGVMIDMMAVGFGEDPEITEDGAMCVSEGFVGAVGLDELYRYLTRFMGGPMTDQEGAAEFTAWFEELPLETQQEVAALYPDCG
jgi:hypothetical protein